jgi:hypothetical protein
MTGSEQKQCEHCGIWFTAKRHYPPRKFCEQRCQQKHAIYLRGLERAAGRSVAAKLKPKPKTKRGKQFQIHGDAKPVVLRSEAKHSKGKFTDEAFYAELEKIGAALGSPGWLRQREAA